MKPKPEVGVYEPPRMSLPWLAFVRYPDGHDIIRSFDTKAEALLFTEALVVDQHLGSGVRK